MYQARDVVRSEAELRAVLGEIAPSQVDKVIDRLDDHCRAWIERSPFMVIASADGGGRFDVSPRGDAPGFVRVLDAQTLAVPDRLGNHRGDTLTNVLQNPRVGLLFAVPRRREMLRVGGSAQIVRDPDLLATLAVGDRLPKLALVVRVDEAMFHGGKAMIRSGLWQPERWPSVLGLPSYAQALTDHAAPPHSCEEMEERIARDDCERLYDE